MYTLVGEVVIDSTTVCALIVGLVLRNVVLERWAFLTMVFKFMAGDALPRLNSAECFSNVNLMQDSRRLYQQR